MFLSQTSQSVWSPNTDVYETPDSLVVKMELAGIETKDLEITLNERMLTVRGCRHDPCRKRRCSFRQMEIDYGPFERLLLIPRGVDGNQAQARFDHGVLTIQLPKAEQSHHTLVTIVIQPSP